MMLGVSKTKQKILVLVGESASGKSTIEKMITERNPDIKKIVSYTTRPIRNGEINDADYHFVSESMFGNMKENDAFIESAEYRGWKYGSAKYDYLDGFDHVVVLTPHGCRQLKKWAQSHTTLDIISVYFDVDRRSRMIKIIERGDDIDEAYRRNLSDVGQFDGFSDEADYTVHNHHYHKTEEDVYNKIRGLIYPKIILSK